MNGSILKIRTNILAPFHNLGRKKWNSNPDSGINIIEEKEKNNCETFEERVKRDQIINTDLSEVIDKLYSITINNQIIKEGLENEWLAYLQNTVTNFETIPLIENLIQKLFTLARVPYKLCIPAIKDYALIEQLIYFSVNGENLRIYLGIPKENKELVMMAN